jgi:hypothetical protein
MPRVSKKQLAPSITEKQKNSKISSWVKDLNQKPAFLRKSNR